jgi:FkbM family methyltransferase
MIETQEQIFEYFKKHNYDFLPGKDPYTFKPFVGAKILDIGANLGMVTAFWAMNGADVTSYEADPETYKIMVSMLTRVGLKANVTNAAIWSHTGQVNFKGVGHMDGDRVCRNGGIESGPESQPVSCVTFASALGTTMWDCVKMDIEGAEYPVLMSTPLESMRNINYMNLEIHHEKHHPNWLTPQQVETLRRTLGHMFDIKPSVYSDGFWHLFNREHRG